MRDREQSVIEQYDLEILSTRKGRGITIYETNQGIRVLKPVKGSPARIEAEVRLLKQIKGEKLFIIEDCFVNKEGEYVTKGEDGERFLLKEYLDGREWNLEDEQEILKGVELLAHLHKALLFPGEAAIPKGLPLSEEVDKHNRELKRARNFIRERQRKNAFELLFLQMYPDFYEEAEHVKKRLGETQAEALWQKAVEQGSLCHGDFTYHNLVHHQGSIAVLNFEKMYYGVQMDDFYQFFRKVMEKNDWNQNLAKKILEAYNSSRELKKTEVEYLCLCFTYPEKFWKIANHYYNGKKNCIIDKDYQKLETIRKQSVKRREFLAFLDVL